MALTKADVDMALRSTNTRMNGWRAAQAEKNRIMDTYLVRLERDSYEHESRLHKLEMWRERWVNAGVWLCVIAAMAAVFGLGVLVG